MTASTHAPVSLLHHFAELDDPRSAHTRLHGLLDIIALTLLCAVVSWGLECWTDVESYGLEKYGWLATFLELPNGIPSHDTAGPGFALMDAGRFIANVS